MDGFKRELRRSVQGPLIVGIIATVSGSFLRALCLNKLASLSFLSLCCQGNELLQSQCEECAFLQYKKAGILAEVFTATGGLIALLCLIFQICCRYAWRHWCCKRRPPPLATLGEPMNPPVRARCGVVALWLSSGILTALLPVVFWFGLEGRPPTYVNQFSAHIAGCTTLFCFTLHRLLSRKAPNISKPSYSILCGPSWASLAAIFVLFAIYCVTQPLGRFGTDSPLDPSVEIGFPDNHTWSGFLTALSILVWEASHFSLYKRPYMNCVHAAWRGSVTLIVVGVSLAILLFQDMNAVSLSDIFMSIHGVRWICCIQLGSGFLLFMGTSTICACGTPLLCCMTRAGGFALSGLLTQSTSDTIYTCRIVALVALALPVSLSRCFISLKAAHQLRLKHASESALISEGLERLQKVPNRGRVQRYFGRAHSSFQHAVKEAVKSPILCTQEHLRSSKSYGRTYTSAAESSYVLATSKSCPPRRF
eukprot:Blabericola_migrator_1__2493@NODE_16_length_23467_cov_90_205256_g13_i0_p7_GENE_NODE_16_length_23467_cov_90_205256_g13_i0NODE_16_length_23467_cov_90_205256_g13_i0_p7_ORF_typecomplete_len479_score10_35_NODE_16_length_23467_cov_90_205256_g13_i01987321309